MSGLKNHLVTKFTVDQLWCRSWIVSFLIQHYNQQSGLEWLCLGFCQPWIIILQEAVDRESFWLYSMLKIRAAHSKFLNVTSSSMQIYLAKDLQKWWLWLCEKSSLLESNVQDWRHLRNEEYYIRLRHHKQQLKRIFGTTKFTHFRFTHMIHFSFKSLCFGLHHLLFN